MQFLAETRHNFLILACNCKILPKNVDMLVFLSEIDKFLNIEVESSGKCWFFPFEIDSFSNINVWWCPGDQDGHFKKNIDVLFFV